MSDIAIEVKDLGKLYKLGEIGTGTISHDLNRWWHKMRGLEDPYVKIGKVNNRTATAANEYVWALQDINFTVRMGEVWGIIGPNGAGKSTLLKILSKITKPTKGNITNHWTYCKFAGSGHRLSPGNDGSRKYLYEWGHYGNDQE